MDYLSYVPETGHKLSFVSVNGTREAYYMNPPRRFPPLLGPTFKIFKIKFSNPGPAESKTDVLRPEPGGTF